MQTQEPSRLSESRSSPGLVLGSRRENTYAYTYTYGSDPCSKVPPRASSELGTASQSQTHTSTTTNAAHNIHATCTPPMRRARSDLGTRNHPFSLTDENLPSSCCNSTHAHVHDVQKQQQIVVKTVYIPDVGWASQVGV